MANAVDAQGQVFKNGSATLLARIVGKDAANVAQADISSAVYSIYLLDEDDPDSRTVVSGHDEASLAVADIIYDTLQTDAIWSVDATGYNFSHVVDVSTDTAFEIAGRDYLVEFTLTPVTGQVIIVRFKVRAI